MAISNLIISLLIHALFLRFSNGLSEKPNIILILTDDQDVVLHGLLPMTKTQKLLGAKGTTFMNAFTSTPICCPSRASILSGKYAHNHATTNNTRSGGCYSDYWQEKVEPHSLPVHLHNGGYETFFAGKYLNEYFSNKVPPGWSKFYGLHGNSKYYNYTVTENGHVVNYEDEYYTDEINAKVMNFIKNRDSNTPFFAMIAPPAPHAPSTPASRHNETFKDLKSLRTPNFNVRQKGLDKHWLLTFGPTLSDDIIDTIDIHYRKRWQSLLAVDDMVENLIDLLTEKKILNNTYIIYTSDNGYHIGQFAQPFDKRQPYETDIRVPFIVRGPQIPAKRVTTLPTLLIDIYPTILEWAGISPPTDVDGESFKEAVQLATRNSLEKDYSSRVMLVEYWGEGNLNTYNPKCPWKKEDRLALCTSDVDCFCQDSWNNTYSCIRHYAYKTNLIYCEFKDHENFVEAYDLYSDPYQMKNIGYEMLPSERAWYSLSLGHMKSCMGDTCRNPALRNALLNDVYEK